MANDDKLNKNSLYDGDQKKGTLWVYLHNKQHTFTKSHEAEILRCRINFRSEMGSAHKEHHSCRFAQAVFLMKVSPTCTDIN